MLPSPQPLSVTRRRAGTVPRAFNAGRLYPKRLGGYPDYLQGRRGVSPLHEPSNCAGTVPMHVNYLGTVPGAFPLWLAWTLSKLTGDDYLRTGTFLKHPDEYFSE